MLLSWTRIHVYRQINLNGIENMKVTLIGYFLFYSTVVINSKCISIISAAGFVDLPGLTAEDHVTLTIVEHYLDFKVHCYLHAT